MSVWLLCILVYSSLGLSCLVLSGIPRFSWLFPFPMLGKFSAITSSNIFSDPFSLSLFFLFAICFRHYVFVCLFVCFIFYDCKHFLSFYQKFQVSQGFGKGTHMLEHGCVIRGKSWIFKLLHKFQVNSVIVWHIYTLHRDHHHKSSFHSSSYSWIPAWYRCSLSPPNFPLQSELSKSEIRTDSTWFLKN